MIRQLRTLWGAYLVIGIAMLIAYLMVPSGMKGYAYEVFAPYGLLGVAGGLRRNRPGTRAPFVALSAALALSSIADITYLVLGKTLGEVPYPSFADALYIAGYIGYVVAFALLIRGRKGGRDFGGIIDVTITVVSVSLIEFVAVIQPNVWDASQPLLMRAVSTSYPLVDIVILGFLAKLLVSPGARAPAFRLFVVAFVLMLGGDSVYGIVMQLGVYDGGLIDITWIGAYVLVGAAVLHPSIATLAEPVPDVVKTLTSRRIVALAMLALAAPIAYGVTAQTAQPAEIAIAITVGSALLFLLVIARIAGLVRVVNGTMRELIEAQGARHRLLHKTLRASEDHRAQLAMQLHDGPVQHLTAISYRLQSTLSSAGVEDAATLRGFDDVQRGLTKQIGDLRAMMAALRPGVLEERGLNGAIKDFASDALRERDLDCHFEMEMPSRLPRDVEVLLYRVAQEAITNVARHARAKTVWIKLAEQHGDAVLQIVDDGVGYDGSPGRSGVPSMRERVEMIDGRFTISGRRGQGTIVEACIPMAVAA